jgi:SAM-dependent methyltransferase
MSFYKSSEHSLSQHYREGLEFKSDFRNYNLFNLVASLVRGPKVLDVGSGPGFFIKTLLSKGLEVYGLEPNNDLVLDSNRNIPEAKVIRGFAEDIEKIFSENFDSITMLDVLEHIENESSVLEIIHRKLNNNGQLVLVVPAHQWLFGKRDIKYGHYRRYSKNGLEELLKSKGFEVSKIRFWNMLGVLPYFISEKILKRELELNSRGEKDSLFSRVLRWKLNLWVKFIENNINFGFGLSLICVAKKKSFS